MSRGTALALVLCLGLVLQLPTLSVGFFADDYLHQIVLSGGDAGIPTLRWSLYDFGTAADWAAFGRERGALPWWTDADWSVRFFRPLTSLSLVFDHALFGRGALGYHLVSIGLWLLLLVLVERLYRALGLGERAGRIGLFFFALSDASSVPVGWIANRNSLFEALFAVGALVCALRGTGARALVGALALAGAAALSKESGVVTFAVLALLWLVRAQGLEPGARRRTHLAALAAVLLALAHVGLLAAAGFGTRSLFYATPWHEPGRFLGNLALLLTGGWISLAAPFPLDAAQLLPAAKTAMLVLGLVFGVPLALWVVRRTRAHPAGPLLAAWTLLFLLPQGGVLASDRLLFVPAVGACALLALVWTGERERWGEASLARRAGVLALGASLTLGSGASLAFQNQNLANMAGHVRSRILATDVGARELGRRDVVVLQTENQMQGFALGETWHVERDDPDVRFWPLQMGARPLRWTRVDERTFELETLAEPFLVHPFESVYRTSAPPPPPGSRRATALFTVEPLVLGEHGLTRFRVTLERSLDDPSLRFVRPVDGFLTRIDPPAIGMTIELAAAVSTSPFVP